jgi:hypothetical protein
VDGSGRSVFGNAGWPFGAFQDDSRAVRARCRQNASAHDEHQRQKPIRFAVAKLEDSGRHCGRSHESNQQPKAANDECAFVAALQFRRRAEIQMRMLILIHLSHLKFFTWFRESPT